MLAGRGRRVVVAGPSETGVDVMRDMIDVITWMCARLCGGWGARDRAVCVVTAARRDLVG